MRSSLKIYWALFGLVAFLLIFLQYFGLVYYHYPVPPGHDAMMHWWIIKPIFEDKTTFIQIWGQGGYPPGFHYFISSLAQVCHTDPMNIMLWFCPSILVLAGLSIFWFAYKVFNPNIALASFFAYAFMAKTPLQQLNDGGYPNLLGAQVVLPMFFLLFCGLITAKTIRGRIIQAVLVILALILIGLLHHISLFYGLGTALIFLPVYIVYLRFRKRISAWGTLILLACTLMLYVVFFYIYNSWGVFAPFRSFSDTVVVLNNSFPFFRIVGSQDQEAIVGLLHYPGYLGLFLSLYAFIGFLCAISFLRKQREEFRIGLIVLFILGTILFLGSRLGFLTNPDRLVRDLALPLSIFAGIGLAGIFDYLRTLNLRGSLRFIPAMVLFLLIIIPLANRGRKAFAYEPMVRFTSADLKATSVLMKEPAGKILVEGYDFYLQRFLPDWEITDLWLPQTYQPPSIHPLDPDISGELADLRQYDYVYIVDNQIGWVPSAIKFRFAEKYIENKNFELIAHEKSPVNEIYLFRVKR